MVLEQTVPCTLYIYTVEAISNLKDAKKNRLPQKRDEIQY